MNNPKFSIIIPAFNTEKYIKRSIQSVLDQSLQDFEIIVVDDASTDSTFQIVDSFKDSRIKLIQNLSRLGAGASRNIALEVARGEWIAVLDSDDWYSSSRLEVLLRIASDHNADIVADDLYLINSQDEKPWSTLLQRSSNQFNKLIYVNSIFFVVDNTEGKGGAHTGYSKPIFRRSLIEDNRIRYLADIKISEDFWFCMECLIKGAHFVLVNHPYYYYREREGALTMSLTQIDRLSEECHAVSNFIERNKLYLDSHPDLFYALNSKRREAQRQLDYYCVVQPLKAGRIIEAIYKILCNSNFFKTLPRNLANALKRRVLYLVIGKDKISRKFS